MSAQPKQRLTWFLLKSDVDPADLGAVLEEPETGTLHSYRVPVLHRKRDSLVIKSTPPVSPRWLGYVDEHVAGGKLPPVYGASSSALLLVVAAKRVLAVTFGYGRWLVRDETIVQDFGLKVVLNSVNPAQIKSVDARTFDELTVHTRRGVSHNSPLTAFELDVTRNLLRGITGSSETPELPGQITGAASLAMNTPVQLPRLPELGSTLITTYKARRYRKHFRFVDDMRAERDPTTIETLDELLLDALKSGEITDMHLAIPEAVDWQEIAGIRFSFKQKRHELTPDPSISVYRQLRDPTTLTVDRLKKDKVQAVSAVDSSQLKGQWKVYDCIVYETEHDKYLYVLSGEIGIESTKVTGRPLKLSFAPFPNSTSACRQLSPATMRVRTTSEQLKQSERFVSTGSSSTRADRTVPRFATFSRTTASSSTSRSAAAVPR